MLLFAGSTPDPLDHLFGWQLLTVLQAIGALRVEGKSGCAVAQVSLFCFYRFVLSRGIFDIGPLRVVMGRSTRTLEVRCYSVEDLARSHPTAFHIASLQDGSPVSLRARNNKEQ